MEVKAATSPGRAAQLHHLLERDPRSPDRPAPTRSSPPSERAGQTPPELGADIAERGMMLTGGGAGSCTTWTASFPRTGLPCWWPKTR